MAIVEIPKSVFERFEHLESCRRHWNREHERVWAADTVGRVLGVMLHNPDSGGWGYSICLRGEEGQYQRVAFVPDAPDAEVARRELFAQMRQL